MWATPDREKIAIHLKDWIAWENIIDLMEAEQRATCTTDVETQEHLCRRKLIRFGKHEIEYIRKAICDICK